MNKEKVKKAVYDLLVALGENPNREGLKDTPKRVANMYLETLSKPELKYTCFNNDNNGNMVLIKDIEFCSTCEHHLMPFFGIAHIAYYPKNKIIGISKLARIVEKYARRLQVQERMTEQIVADIKKHLDIKDVAIYIEAKHLCMIARGVKKPSASTITTNYSGVFKKTDVKSEFLILISEKRN